MKQLPARRAQADVGASERREKIIRATSNHGRRESRAREYHGAVGNESSLRSHLPAHLALFVMLSPCELCDCRHVM